ncbi:hypothetical protein [Qipengyuania sphaerica]|uniref:hypothetical protein n=1 Tax=Qipengyuania sphaerica TaxID=2867243 RepID=UPI001C877396|nr:hypothetical protein [Qipengyuania sphaerica]MBX7540540.1 hypothetical protein [Qipengyuania sphaerica]
MRKPVYLALSTGLALGGCAVSDKGIDGLPEVPVLHTVADVTGSDGSQFTVTTGYGPTGSFYKAVYPDRVVHYTTDGETAFVHDEDGIHELPDSMLFYIQSQMFHAQVAEFAALNDGIWQRRPCDPDPAQCREKIGRIGSGPLGVTYRALQTDPRTGIPYAVLNYRKKQPPIVARFSDWRTVDGIPLAYHVTVEDGERTFEYRYRSIEGL